MLVREPGAQVGYSLVFSLVHLPLLDSNPTGKNSESKPGCRRKDAKIRVGEICLGKCPHWLEGKALSQLPVAWPEIARAHG